MTQQEDSRFQVNLGGLIDILANHLYSGPQVYIRELLQNATDAIRARESTDDAFRGSVRVEIIQPEEGPPTLAFQDNGIGLTPEEIELFLATVGQSSKVDLINRDVDYIGRFGIGLLSCFMVCDEIVVITRSARDGGKSLKWEGRADGTYTVQELEHETPIGTQVYIRAKPTSYEFFDPQFVERSLKRNGKYLGVDIEFDGDGRQQRVNEIPVWEIFDPTEPASRERVLALASEQLGEELLDVFPISSEVGAVAGLAFVLSTPSSRPSQKAHHVYLKRMMLSESMNNLLPDWAFFVRVIANINDLRPTASREALVENHEFQSARDNLGRAVRGYLMKLARTDSDAFDVVLGVHHGAIKALCVDDEECLKVFGDWLPFETTLGRMRLRDFRKQEETIRYVRTVDEFRSIKQVAAAQSFAVINAGYVHDIDVLSRLHFVFSDVNVVKFEQSELAERFTELTLDEAEQVVTFAKLAEAALLPFHCEVEVVKFQPSELPTLFLTNDASEFLRNIQQTQESADNTWSTVLDGLATQAHSAAQARLFLNLNNPIIQRAIRVEDRRCLRTISEVLYAQALLLGNHPMREREMKLLNRGLLDLVNRAVKE